MSKTNTEIVTKFETRSLAWAFMRECDDAGISAGYPQIQADGTYTVRTLAVR